MGGIGGSRVGDSPARLFLFMDRPAQLNTDYLRRLIKEVRGEVPQQDADKLRMYFGQGPKTMRAETPR